ncbi:hypothetical protein [Candidatus Nucleicultrix amoebiphila]|jgi:hypothetical protein|uniref:Uncharacterized protein n=1 Tax=Candidatus Nucleicultrix amoebiphila FS5 TaxID=1414854 RepID=A0A1W6N3L0_9PROT|nr:hypothetical protein [Candidatus Nucleicultrix amoebiphila]ARN84341.1 hypothetical protein GQ61_02230 [Candidatus Nucleicultrix amoebiphila FS5]
MKTVLLSAVILTTFFTVAKATNVDESCPDKQSLLVALGKIHGEMTGKSFEFTDKNGKKWRGSNLVEHASRVNLATGAKPTFTPLSPTECHVSYEKAIDTPTGKGTGIATILTVYLTRE